MRFMCLVMVLLCGACGTWPRAKHDTEGIAQVQSVGLRMKYLLQYGKAIRHARGITRETSVSQLGQRVSAIHAEVLASRHRLEAAIAQMDNEHEILHLNADFQQLNLAFQQKLPYRADDGSLLLAVDFTRVQAEVGDPILKQLQEIDTLLSTPLLGAEKGLDN